MIEIKEKAKEYVNQLQLYSKADIIDVISNTCFSVEIDKALHKLWQKKNKELFDNMMILSQAETQAFKELTELKQALGNKYVTTFTVFDLSSTDLEQYMQAHNKWRNTATMLDIASKEYDDFILKTQGKP